MKAAGAVDEDCGLERLFSEGVVADTIVGEVVEDFECEDVARGWDVSFPVEN